MAYDAKTANKPMESIIDADDKWKATLNTMKSNANQSAYQNKNSRRLNNATRDTASVSSEMDHKDNENNMGGFYDKGVYIDPRKNS